MGLPNISIVEIVNIFQTQYDIRDVENPHKGGQKVVFPCIIDGQKCAILAILLGSDSDQTDDEFEESFISEAERRAKREVDILQKCTSDHIG